MKDLLHKYHPDLYYTDGGIPFKKAGLNILSDFYNQNQDRQGHFRHAALDDLGGRSDLHDRFCRRHAQGYSLHQE